MNGCCTLDHASAAVTSWFGVNVRPLKNECCMILGLNLPQKLSLELASGEEVYSFSSHILRKRKVVYVFFFLCVCVSVICALPTHTKYLCDFVGR